MKKSILWILLALACVGFFELMRRISDVKERRFGGCVCLFQQRQACSKRQKNLKILTNELLI